MKRLLASSFVIVTALVVMTVPPARAQDNTPPSCTIVANSDVTAYTTADTSAPSITMPAGVQAQVQGQTYDQQWIAFEPGIAQAGNMGLARLRWVPANSDITLSGDCASLPMLNPPPATGCTMVFGGTIPAYTQPDSSAPVFTQLGVTDYALIVGQVSSGWYAMASPGAQAGATGTINLRWIEDDLAVQLTGLCDQLPTFYPVPRLNGEMCTLLTGPNAQTYAAPDAYAAATSLPGMVVQVLAQTSGQWYGYDPGDAQNGAVGVARLRWIPASDVDQLRGDCQHVPAVSPTPIALSFTDDNTTITVHTGDTIVITLPGENPDTGNQWFELPGEMIANDHAVVQMQGSPQFDPGGMITLTYQAVGPGETLIALAYGQKNGMTGSTSVAAQPMSFGVTVRVENQP